MNKLTHIDEHGHAKMVDTSENPPPTRRAIAAARVLMSSATVAAIRDHTTPKGDPLETARLAGIVAAKRTAELIPLCHPLPLTHVDVRAEVADDGVELEAEVTARAQTGVEMEALTAVLGGGVPVCDLC